ncbi:MAG: MBOAT family protein [Ruminococcus sp.]|uniref:MBOAT family O-acyltransferase n=1 Tax=Ruminococcus sp. JE7B6 TaxID=3233380 RepID=UPI002E83028D|nr:MBOAT family protein [Ruminococcus sp.]MBQ5631454.1 MBOAT family protein [Ruminococcus sp.]MBR0336965.1 MBOAT family protein [Ruminococcus sp.]MEE3474044.1 MBOAT family O-acyltransferase [Ruminococcus sp.]
MTYTSLNFIFFVLATALVYFVLPFKKYRWTVLLAASIFFYCTWSYQLGAFMLFTTLSTYLIALWLNRVSVKSKAVLKEHKSEWSRDDKKKYKNKTKVRMRLVMTLALLLNFGILAFLKYYNFFAGSLNDILGAFSLDFSAPSLKLILPLGISFYTFQSMGYIVDVYREKTAPQKNPLKLLLFVSFFPQIIQGPISIYDQLAVQLFEGHDFDFTRFKHGCELIMWGFFKKLVIADRAVIAITAVTADYNKFGGTTLTFTVLLYALQLYADFSGGIDISRGVAQIFGVDMIDNFKRPYFSRSINEYWRRWHISLGAWLKNYLFYPVAMSNAFITASKKMKGTRFGKTAAGAHISKVLPTSVASLIVFLVVGIWHGASWKYVAFGAWNGMIIMVSILLEPLFISAKDKLHIKDTNIPFMLFQMFRTFLIVLVGYVFDVAPSFSQAMRTFWLFFTNQNFKLGYSQISDLGLGKKDYLVVLIGGLIIFIASIIQERAKNGLDIRHMLDQKPFILRFALLFVALISIVVFGIYGSGYSAADFVYAQF